MKTRKKKEKERARFRKAKELIKSAPSFIERNEETYFDYNLDYKEAKEVMAWVNMM